MSQYIPIAQIAVAVILVVFILFQQRETAFGSGQGVYSTRRGIQQKLFWGTVILGIIFIALAVLNLLIK